MPYYYYLLGISIAVCLDQSDILEIWKKKCKDNIILLMFSSFILFFVIGIYFYLRNGNYIVPKIIDNFVALVIIILVITINSIKIVNVIGDFFVFIGAHSMNIFMVHTFIKLYFFKDFSYSFGYYWLNLLVLIINCLLISIMIEIIKKKCGIIKFQKNIYIFKEID